MDKVERIHALDQIKLLSDSRRMAILRLLMDRPATLTDLARVLGQSPAWVRHHLQKLEGAQLVELTEVRTTGKVTEKFYRARAGAFLLQGLVLPQSDKPALIFSGSHDLALEAAAAHLEKHAHLLTLPVGSLDGLVNLRQGLCQVSGAHLLDPDGEYNLPFVRHIFPDRDMELVTLAHRTQGLILAPGNPKGIHALADLARAGLRFVNRNPGSGTRLWFDTELRRLGMSAEGIAGYERAVSTHTACAGVVASGEADAGLGLQAAAHQAGLDFIPLFEERYDLVLPRENQAALAPLLDYLQSAAFRRNALSLTGYTTAHSGEQITLSS